jgi:SAM-dependent methyltransferase
MGPVGRRLRDALKRYPPLYRAARAARLAVGRRLPPRRIEGIAGPVHRNDLMLPIVTGASVAAYARVGREAADAIEEAVRLAGRSAAVDDVLDLGCGHGRVLRVLRERFPAAVVTGCDLDPEATAFCAAELGARPLPGAEDFEQIDFATYDVVWMGSLVTHLPTDRWHQLADVLGRVLRDEGVLVFSTHGEQALHDLDHYGPGLEARRAEITGALAQRGHVYVPYDHYAGDAYGVAFHTTDEVQRTVSGALGGRTRRLLHRPAGWGGHQDLHAFQKLA